MNEWSLCPRSANVSYGIHSGHTRQTYTKSLACQVSDADAVGGRIPEHGSYISSEWR